MTPSVTLFTDHVETPTGLMILAADELGRLRALEWTTVGERDLQPADRRWARGFRLEPRPDPFGLSSRLRRWFVGELDAFDGVEVEPVGTAFQREVWRALTTIPAGETLSYGGLAARIGRPKAMRAVGLANGANPVALVLPCHRVIGADRTLTGYGGGLHRKQWLLDHERRHAPRAALELAAA